MKLNWGHAIFIFYGLFMAAMLTMVIATTYYPSDLETQDYYAKAVAYESQMDKMGAYSSLEKPVEIVYDGEAKSVLINYPNGKPSSGKVSFYRPSDASMDFEVDAIATEDGEQSVDANDMAAGLWQIRIDWQVKGQSYYKESPLVIY